MEFNVYLFPNQVKLGQINFDIVSMHKFFAMNDCHCEKLVFLDYDKEKCWEEFEKEEKNKIVLMENSNIDEFTFSKLSNLGKYVGTIDEQALVFEKEGNKIVFLPIDNDWQGLLKKIIKVRDGRNVYSFKLFATDLKEVTKELEDIKNSFEGFEYTCFYNNLLCDVHISYLGQAGQIDEVQLRVASKFKDIMISENGHDIEQILFQLLRLKNLKIAICDGATGGYLENRLYSRQNFDEVVKTIKIESEFCASTTEGVYNFSLNMLDKSGADIVVAITKLESGNSQEFVFAIADKKAVHVYKNKFNGIANENKIMATNSALFQLLKKLKQNDFVF